MYGSCCESVIYSEGGSYRIKSETLQLRTWHKRAIVFKSILVTSFLQKKSIFYPTRYHNDTL